MSKKPLTRRAFLLGSVASGVSTAALAKPIKPPAQSITFGGVGALIAPTTAPLGSFVLGVNALA